MQVQIIFLLYEKGIIFSVVKKYEVLNQTFLKMINILFLTPQKAMGCLIYENLHGHFVIQFLGQIIWSLKTDKHKKLPSMIAIHTQQQQLMCTKSDTKSLI